MHKFAILVACLMCTGHGRRVHVNCERPQVDSAEKRAQSREKAGTPVEDRGLRPLATLLRLTDLRAGWQVTGAGHSCDPARSHCFSNRARQAKRASGSQSRLRLPGDASMHAVHKCAGALAVPEGSPKAVAARRCLLGTRVLASMACTFAMLGLSVRRASAAGLLDGLILKASSSGFVQAFLLVFLSELGDKTFFLAALLAAKFTRMLAFIGSIIALAAMTVISTGLGHMCQAIPPGITQGVPFADIAAVVSFTFFGAKTLYDAARLPAGDSSGIEEGKKEAEADVEKLSSTQIRRSALTAIASTFGLVFAAEIGDRSFISTIALAAALNPIAVGIGAILAHASATGIAVAGGFFVSKHMSEKLIGYIGGSLFLVFALTTALGVF